MTSIYLPSERGASLRRMEARIAAPLDPELEAWEMSRRTFVTDGREVAAMKRIEGGGFTAARPTDIIYANQAAGTAKASFTSEVGINDTAGMGPQGKLNPYYFDARPSGQETMIGIKARGILASTGTPTYTYSFRLGASGTAGPLVLGSAALTTGSGVSAQLWEFEGDVQMVTQGAAGANSTVRGLGLINCPGGLASPFSYALFGGAASPGTVATFDISITNFLNFNLTCSSSSSSNTITLLQLICLGWN